MEDEEEEIEDGQAIIYDDFIVTCNGEIFVCTRPDKSVVFKKEMKCGNTEIELSTDIDVVRCVMHFIETDELIVHAAVDIAKLAQTGVSLKIESFVEHMADVLVEYCKDKTPEELMDFLGIKEINRDEISEECLWIYNLI
jgi:excinuclease UvrABC helicase subunit UvrB